MFCIDENSVHLYELATYTNLHTKTFTLEHGKFEKILTLDGP